MLENLVAWVLNNYLGKYVENLNTDQLSIAILSGEVELENLPLRRDALRHLGIPIEIRAGHIGKVKLQIPIRQLRSAPWVIVIEQLYLVAGPLSLDDWDQAAEEAADQERKLAALDAIEACWRLESDGSSTSTSNYYASSYSSWLSFGTGIITDIVENMQLRVRDVHLRYEDESNACACGLTIQSLSAQSCDASWTPQFTTHRDGTDLSFKNIELMKLAVYWDSVAGPAGFKSHLPAQELAQAMTGEGMEHQYLIAPVSACAHLQRNRSELPLRSSATPRIVCDLELDQVPLALVDWQYEQMVSCIRALEFLTRVQHYRRGRRPSVPVLEDPRAWWHYAVACHAPDTCRPRPTWTECLQCAGENIRYVDLYVRLLTQPSAALPADAKLLKDTVEWSRDFQQLKILREVAMRRVPCPLGVPLPTNQKRDGRNMLVRWFPQWWGWYSAPPPAPQPELNENEVNTTAGTGGHHQVHQLEDEILEALADSAKNNTLLRRDVVFGKFNFSLNSGTLDLCSSNSTSSETRVLPMIQLQFSELRAGVESRPRSSSHCIELSLGALYLKDRLTPGTLFPVLVGPPGQDRVAAQGRNNSRTKPNRSGEEAETVSGPLFHLAYESSATGRRLHVRSQPLDVVYQPAAVKWLLEFVCAPHQRTSARNRLEAMKSRTKQELMDKWDSMLEGKAAVRTSWDLRLDVSAPQLILVERFCDPAAAIAVVDLGTLKLSNSLTQPNNNAQMHKSQSQDEDEEMFMTPCSTPPGSGTESIDDQTLVTALSELSLHRRLYDTFQIELRDIQVLVGRVRDNWRYAHTKGSSSLHVLDRFNISLQVERRVIPTTDPLYPGLVFVANLPRLVVHVNEQKISAIRTLALVISESSLPSPLANQSPYHVPPQSQSSASLTSLPAHLLDESTEGDASTESSRLLTLQFSIDQMSLEVQSRGRSIAELQVSGVTASLMRRPQNLVLSLTVHGLLLVDALQTFGPDFELLVASHRHVGMDSVSGSLRDSEPTSPTSPGSPDPNAGARAARATSPITLTQALSGLAVSPPPYTAANLGFQGMLHDAEALISVEFILVTGDEPIQFASIQFNNLDIIANQETIVELVGFVRRVLPARSKCQSATPRPGEKIDEVDGSQTQLNHLSSSMDLLDDLSSSETDSKLSNKTTRTELTFDFHRLSVLLLRGGIEDGRAVGKKIGTATMCDARIQASVGSTVAVHGSLGGLQVLDLTPKGHLHQRIISVGRDPFTDDPQKTITPPAPGDPDETAFSFNVNRILYETKTPEPVDVSIRMASVWYTHSPHFITELRSCATEFKQYLADVARSIRSAATDVAIGLVHARTEALAQSLYVNNTRISGLVGDTSSPRRFRRRSTSESHTPFSPVEGEDVDVGFSGEIKIDIVLDSPVIVLPRSSGSVHVLVAHLGKIAVSNINNNTGTKTYTVEIRDMSLCTLDTTRKTPSIIPRVDKLYACGPQSRAVPVLHDTLVRLTVTKHNSDPIINPDCFNFDDLGDLVQIEGSVVSALRVSLTRAQYEQVLDTIQWLTGTGMDQPSEPVTNGQRPTSLSEIMEEDVGGVSTLSMDPHVRAKLFPSASRRTTGRAQTTTQTNQLAAVPAHRFDIQFEIASFGVEIRNQNGQGLVGLSFQDFLIRCVKNKPYITDVQVSLRNLLVEDLLVPETDIRRTMVASKDDSPTLHQTGVSQSCPTVGLHPMEFKYGSLPDHLDTDTVYGGFIPKKFTPRIVQSQRDGLVLIKSILVDPIVPDFATEYNSMRRTTTIDLGSVDMVVSATSWTTLLNFFSVTTSDEDSSPQVELNPKPTDQMQVPLGDSSTSVTLHSFTLLATRFNSREIARARVTDALVQITRNQSRRQVSGHLGALRILDSTQSAHACDERFVTIGERAVQFLFWRPVTKCNEFDSEFKLELSPCVYVHTKRFLTEVRAFFGDFYRSDGGSSAGGGTKQKKTDDQMKVSRMSFIVHVDTPVVLVPIRPYCSDLLVLDLGQLTIANEFKPDEEQPAAVLDIMCIGLHDVDVYAGEVIQTDSDRPKSAEVVRRFGGCSVIRKSASFSEEKCKLDFYYSRNVTGRGRPFVPDMTISSSLSTLDLSLDLQQYALVRGMLAFNLGEDTEHILPSVPYDSSNDRVWILSSVRIALLDVKVRLKPLACVNFVRSRLTVDSFSDLSQDIDLISHQVLITDERDNCPNIFTEVLHQVNRQQMNPTSVQTEVHSRRRPDKSKLTVLLNNMRLMAVVDWWQMAYDFIITQHTLPKATENYERLNRLTPPVPSAQPVEQHPFEFNLNITDSEIVVVEDIAKKDTNALILRSTTLVSYKVYGNDSRPLSCSVNHLELFSCVLGLNRDEDEETALSILDPVTISADVINQSDQPRTLDIQLHELTVRLSYKDMLMFAAMLDSVTKQMKIKPKPEVNEPVIKEVYGNVHKLQALGFSSVDCEQALAVCRDKIDDAALWLTQNAQPVRAEASELFIQVIEVRATLFRLCLIDDCGDVDVPLAEASLTNVCFSYDFNSAESPTQQKRCTIDCSLSVDYYNRVLGGWEPFLENWKCRALWIPEDSPIGVSRHRHRIAIQSDDVMNINVTDALLALLRLVKESWSKEQIVSVHKMATRQPFVPYSLKNDTGSVLYFATVITEPDEPFYPMDEELYEKDQTILPPEVQDLEWSEVEPGATIPFSYGGRAKQRHKESHMMRAHQLAVRVMGWRAAAPVTVDKVGVYFRNAYAERGKQVYNRQVRLVFDVRLDGTARKLVTVRSAMVLVNRLLESVDVKLVERSTAKAISTAKRTAVVPSGGSLALPLAHAHSHIFVRPSDSKDSFSYCQPDIPWSKLCRPGERSYNVLKCTKNRGDEYWLCCDVRRERYPPDVTGRPTTPAHTMLLLPAVLIVNLLPQELHFSVTATAEDEPAQVMARGRVPAGRGTSVPAVNPDAGLELSLHIDNFRCASGVCVPAWNMLDIAGEFSCRVRLEDADKRKLFLNARLEPNRGARVRLTITAPYWIVNRTGLPLVFRQEGVGADSAGQFEEHEVARMVAPLLFSFTDQDASPTVVARIGKKHTDATSPIFCQPFHLRRGIQARKLKVTYNAPAQDTVYMVGIEVRPARGRTRHRRDTNIVIISPRLQLYNGSSCKLEFAQACHASSVRDPGAVIVSAPPGSHVPFHWPRLDRDLLLCVRSMKQQDRTTSWSGGIRIDQPMSSHIMLRDSMLGSRALFLHVEIVPQGATNYIVFSDADSLPPPLRVDNCSEVAVIFAQDGCCVHVTVAHAHHSVPYAWDEPTWPERLVVTAPGGAVATYDVGKFGRGQQLTYENFIYVAFIGTFNTEDDLDHYDENDYTGNKRQVKSTAGADLVRLQRLVLDVTDRGRVVLATKQPGKRSQLWRMTSTGQLQHEGSSHPDRHDNRALVLDIEAPAPQPSAPVAASLALRRPDPRRRTTQTWRFTGDGRLCCAHRNMCVQSKDGLLGLRPGSAAVLGAPHESPPHRTVTQGGVPIEQAVGKQRMRPGSGLLSVEITTDGPTRVLRVTDMKQAEPLQAVALVDDGDWIGVSPAYRPAAHCAPPLKTAQKAGIELQVTVMLRGGLGISIVGGSRELLYIQLNNIIAEATLGSRTRDLCISVQDAQCDNQLPDTPCPVLIHAARARTTDEARRQNTLPVLELRAEMQPTAGAVVIFKHLIVCLRPIAVHLEETLILRLYEFLLTATGQDTPNPNQPEDDDDIDIEEEETGTNAITTVVATSSASLTTRYHFGIIRLVPGALKLSVYTSSSLPTRLRTLKRRLGLTLVRFEDAPVELESYIRHHPFETGTRLWRSVFTHFRDELMWQAATILGSVDFLGSPLGLLGDVTEGVSGLIRERSVGALVKNVAHGLSNSAAKVTETLGDGLGRVTMDDAHEEMRQRIRRKHARGSGSDHLVAGIKGLGFGLLGGATGIFKQVYEGATNDGFQGVFSGLGKGLVGAVAKPMVGVLDLATETARAVRDTSRGDRLIPDRRRQPRAAVGPGGLLPPYSIRDSWGQAYLRFLVGNPAEVYVAYECVRSGTDDLRVIVSLERVRVVTGGGGDPTDPTPMSSLTTVTETGLAEVVSCAPITQDGKHYIEVTVWGGTATRRPKIRCDTEELARAVTRQVNYAKRLHEEAAHTLRPLDD